MGRGREAARTETPPCGTCAPYHEGGYWRRADTMVAWPISSGQNQSTNSIEKRVPPATVTDRPCRESNANAIGQSPSGSLERRLTHQRFTVVGRNLSLHRSQWVKVCHPSGPHKASTRCEPVQRFVSRRKQTGALVPRCVGRQERT